MKLFVLMTLLISAIASAQSNFDRLHSIRELKKFAFGSCNKQYGIQLLWTDLIKEAPQLFIWGGDNVYVNSTEPRKIKAAYDLQNTILGYAFFKSRTPIIGTWDDHDYGDNDANGNYAGKVQSQEYALDFFEEPLFSSRRQQEGIFASYEFGENERKVKIILLDNRYFKDLDPEAPLLGKKQWNWLEEELNNSTAHIHFIVSGTSVLSPTNPGSEEWRDYSKEFNRLNKLVDDNQIKGVVFLTGDKHFSSVFTRNGKLEFLSSGMTHNTRLPLRPYVRAKFPSPLFERNYGIVRIDWAESAPVLTFSARTFLGRDANVRKFKWEQGSWKQQAVKGMLSQTEIGMD